VFIGPLPNNGCPLLSCTVVCIIQQRAVYQESVSVGTCFWSCCLAAGRYIIIFPIIFCLVKTMMFRKVDLLPSSGKCVKTTGTRDYLDLLDSAEYVSKFVLMMEAESACETSCY
jgi:tellurite resistance protein TehA-like permease